MKQSTYQNYFKDKKITIMGLGLLGRGIKVTAFLAQNGALLTVTDKKSSLALKSSLKKLQKYKNIQYVLGRHDLRNFEKCDMVVKASGVPLDSPYIEHAKNNGIDVVMDASLFARIAKGVRIVGVTGTRGKSMTTSAIYHVLKENEKKLGVKVHAGGNLRGMATLPLLKKVQAGDSVVLELDSWQLQGFGDEKISPEIAVFTSFMPDHMNYYGSTSLTTSKAMKVYFSDKANIFCNQNKSDTLIIRPGMKKFIKANDVKGKRIVADKKNLIGVKLHVLGEHQIENLACAYEVGKLFGISTKDIKKSLSTFPGLEGRMELLRIFRGIKIYNDNNATTPEATIAGLTSVRGSTSNRSHKSKVKSKNIILIAGGNDKGIPLEGLSKAIKRYTKGVYFLPGTGTHKYLREGHFQKNILLVRNLKEAITLAMKEAKKGDIILFSPAFSSFGQYANEYERNDEFVRIVKRLK